MSLDLFMNIARCPTCEKEFDTVDIYNYTYNVSQMWYEIYPDDKKMGMVYIDGMTGLQSIFKLQHALFVLECAPDEFIAMNPENGWGDYESFKEFISKLIKAAQKNPSGVWESWR